MLSIDRAAHVILVHRSNPPNGPFTVYAQHAFYLNLKGDSRCPRIAFSKDLCHFLSMFDQGDHIVLLIDANSNMKLSDISSKFQELSLQEAILTKHGMSGPSTSGEILLILLLMVFGYLLGFKFKHVAIQGMIPFSLIWITDVSGLIFSLSRPLDIRCQQLYVLPLDVYKLKIRDL